MSEGASSTARRRLPLWVVLGSLFLAGLGALLALNTASAAQELRQRSLTDSNSTLTDTQQQLIRDLAQKQAPAALASAATALGLIPNSNPAFLKLQPDGSVTILGVAAPATAPAATVTPTPTAAPTTTPATAATTPAATTTLAATATPAAPTAAATTAAVSATAPATAVPAAAATTAAAPAATPATSTQAAAAKTAAATPTRTP